jgi:hypothetical protein
MTVYVVFMHEDCFGPEWDYMYGVFSTAERAAEYTHSHKLPDRSNKWSWHIESWVVNQSKED